MMLTFRSKHLKSIMHSRRNLHGKTTWCFSIFGFLMVFSSCLTSDQGLLFNLPVLVQNYMVKCFSRNLLLKHDLPWFLCRGLVHTLRSPQWPEIKMIFTFYWWKQSHKTELKTTFKNPVECYVFFLFNGFAHLSSCCLLQSLVKQLENTMICYWRTLGSIHPMGAKRKQTDLAF